MNDYKPIIINFAGFVGDMILYVRAYEKDLACCNYGLGFNPVLLQYEILRHYMTYDI